MTCGLWFAIYNYFSYYLVGALFHRNSCFDKAAEDITVALLRTPVSG